MRKSNHGKELIFLWETNAGLKPEEVSLKVVPTTLQISDEMQKRIDTEWENTLKDNPHAFDAPKWRAEFVNGTYSTLEIYVSPIFYSQHNVMRHIPNQSMLFYPNPLDIGTIQVTADDYILLGVKGKGSDQKGLGLLGAGFVERYVDHSGITKNPEMLGYVVQKECLEETRYGRKLSFNMNDAKVLAAVFGSNHDTTIGVYLPIFATSKEVALNGNEHNDIILLPNKTEDIASLLKQGAYKGIPASDYVMGCLEAFMMYKKGE